MNNKNNYWLKQKQNYGLMAIIFNMVDFIAEYVSL